MPADLQGNKKNQPDFNKTKKQTNKQTTMKITNKKKQGKFRQARTERVKLWN
jgi:hypothetical protein